MSIRWNQHSVALGLTDSIGTIDGGSATQTRLFGDREVPIHHAYITYSSHNDIIEKLAGLDDLNRSLDEASDQNGNESGETSEDYMRMRPFAAFPPTLLH